MAHRRLGYRPGELVHWAQAREASKDPGAWEDVEVIDVTGRTITVAGETGVVRLYCVFAPRLSAALAGRHAQGRYAAEWHLLSVPPAGTAPIEPPAGVIWTLADGGVTEGAGFDGSSTMLFSVKERDATDAAEAIDALDRPVLRPCRHIPAEACAHPYIDARALLGTTWRVMASATEAEQVEGRQAVWVWPCRTRAEAQDVARRARRSSEVAHVRVSRHLPKEAAACDVRYVDPARCPGWWDPA